MTKWKRRCPNCNTTKIYKRKQGWIKAIKNNLLCPKCCRLGWIPWNKGKKGLQKSPCKGKKYEDFYGIKRAKEISEKISNSEKGRIAWNKGKTNIEIYGKKKANEIGLKISNKLKGRTYDDLHGKEKSNKLKREKRIKMLKNIEERCGTVYPNYNSKTIPILEQKAKELGITDLQHAENGGEYYIKDLGYFVDGYSPSKNIVIEYYELWHNQPKIIKKDNNRKQEIIDFLKCKFIEIRE
jgi:hypothetical protein